MKCKGHSPAIARDQKSRDVSAEITAAHSNEFRRETRWSLPLSGEEGDVHHAHVAALLTLLCQFLIYFNF